MLIAASETADEGDLVALYISQITPLYRYFLHHVRNVQDAEDLTSATLYEALIGRRQFDPARGTFGAWIFGIARHVLYDAQRRHWSHAAAPAPPLYREIPPLDVQLIEDEATTLLHRRVQELPLGQKEAVSLRYFGGLRVKEIATLLARSEAAVKMLLQRGIANLRDRYQQEERDGRTLSR